MDCERKGKWFGGCKFRPRYDKGPAPLLRTTLELVYADEDILETMRQVTYVKDVCVTCGAERVR